MKIEIELTMYDYTILKKISDYSEIDPVKLATGIIINHIENFDSEINEFIEKNLPTSYYN